MARGNDSKSKSRKRNASPVKIKVEQEFPPGDDIIKSPLDPNSYKIIELPNGLKVILTSTIKPEIDLKNPTLRAKALAEIDIFNTKFIKLPKHQESQNEIDSEGDGPPRAKKQKFDNASTSNSVPSICKSERLKSKSNPKLVVSRKRKHSRKKNLINPKNIFHGIVALVVGAGSFQDPADFPGMAHFCEHCITFGSKHYPEKKALQSLIKNCGGSWKATTFPERTVFAFETLAPRGSTELTVFKTAIDILSDTMTNALMPKNWITKEVHAINSEFCIRTLNDYRRLRQIFRSCAQDNHPVQNFSTGNLETLRHGDFHRELCAWKDKYYNAKNMTLAITAPATLEELEKIAVRYFSRLPSGDLIQPTPTAELLQKFSKTPYGTEKFRSFYEIVPAANIQELSLSWELPVEMWQNYETEPLSFIGFLFREGSPISDFLWDKHWITGLNLDIDFSSPFSSVLRIGISLTKPGYKNVDQIIGTIFSYLKTLNSMKDKCILTEFDKLRRIQANSFHFRKQYRSFHDVINLAHKLQCVQKNREVVTAYTVITKFDPVVIRRCLQMLTPRTANFMLISKDFLKNSTSSVSLIEPWYKTQYGVKKLPEKTFKQYENVKKFKKVEFPKIDLLDFNIPAKPEILSENSLPLNTKRAIVRHVNGINESTKDIRVPTVRYSFRISSYFLITQCPQGIVWMKMWVNMLINRLRAVIPNNSAQGLFRTELTIFSDADIGLTISGPATGELSEILEIFIDEFEEFEEDTEELEFNCSKESEIKFYENETLDIDGIYEDFNKFVLRQKHLLFDQKKVIAEDTSFCEFIDFVRNFKAKMFINGELKGPVLRSQKKKVARVIDKMAYEAVPIVIGFEARTMKLPLGENCLRVQGRNPDNPISIIANYYQLGNLSKEAKMSAKSIVSLIKYPAFLQLRTNEQLSYIVSVTSSEQNSVCGITVKIKALASVHSTGYVDERIDAFLDSFHRKNICSQTKLTRLLTANHIDFSPKKLTCIQRMFAHYLLPNGRHFRKISFQILGSRSASCMISGLCPPKPMSEKTLAVKVKKAKSRGKKSGAGAGVNVYFIRDLVTFKKDMHCYPIKDS